jgi:hypothetical protein
MSETENVKRIYPFQLLQDYVRFQFFIVVHLFIEFVTKTHARMNESKLLEDAKDPIVEELNRMNRNKPDPRFGMVIRNSPVSQSEHPMEMIMRVASIFTNQTLIDAELKHVKKDYDDIMRPIGDKINNELKDVQTLALPVEIKTKQEACIVFEKLLICFEVLFAGDHIVEQTTQKEQAEQLLSKQETMFGFLVKEGVITRREYHSATGILATAWNYINEESVFSRMRRKINKMF